MVVVVVVEYKMEFLMILERFGMKKENMSHIGVEVEEEEVGAWNFSDSLKKIQMFVSPVCYCMECGDIEFVKNLGLS